ncbi:MAG: AAA family ATPase [Euryarchaeota archaeon]|nr:AAA family ATPase [Euryarchaeota archaeon]
MWTEEYRPKRLDEIVGHDEVVKRLQGFVKERTIPNLVLWGPKGTGKTSLVYALARELYGEFYDENLMHIETADFVEHGKKWLKENKRFKLFYNEQKSALVIFKEMIREYAALAPINASFKLLFFSNADLLPINAQQALRRIMERSNKTCRFIFSTTKPAGLIPAIRSRCLNLHFGSLDKSGAMELLIRSIADEEGVNITDRGLKTLKNYARGDAGAAITILEAAASPAPAIDEQRIEDVAHNAFFQRQKAEELIDLAFRGRHKDLRARLEFLMREERIGGKELLVEIHEALRRKMQMTKDESSLFARIVVYEGDADLNLCTSFNSMIHVEEMFTKMSQAVGLRSL